METSANNVVEVRLTPEVWAQMTPEEKAKVPPAMAASLEAGLQQATVQQQTGSPLPNVISPNLGDRCITVDTNQALLEEKKLIREKFQSLPLRERHRIKREEEEEHARSWWHVHAIDIKNSNDLSALLAGAILMGIVIGVGYIIVRLIKSN